MYILGSISVVTPASCLRPDLLIQGPAVIIHFQIHTAIFLCRANFDPPSGILQFFNAVLNGIFDQRLQR